MNQTTSDKKLRELCAELYGLTGWETNYAWYYYEVGGPKLEPVVGDMDKPGGGYMIMYDYDTDYLLDKLPKALDVRQTNWLDLSAGGDAWTVMYEYATSEPESPAYMQSADTPRKALLLLAIELKKKGEI
jgi:hypothetical protein